MAMKDEFRKIITTLADRFSVPPIDKMFFPPLYRGGQPRNAEFMAMGLGQGAAGISFVLIGDATGADLYNKLHPDQFIGKDPVAFALEFGSDDPVKEMISLAAINAISHFAMVKMGVEVDSTSDSLGLLNLCAGDRIGMVGLFMPLMGAIKKTGADLVILEKKPELKEKFPRLNITLDPRELKTCNKVLCTSTTILNNSLDNIMTHCDPGAFVSIVGPTAGYFPDPVFARGVDVVGGRVVKDSELFFQLLEQGKKWGDATEKVCFQKSTYRSVV
ncbi:Putative heavy-metal chelation [Desulfocicer vacuolatum DSM 3385]|uniref:Putative heavy-metal chelation n=1 Tax=Desulfocicer vacuolatum DSM 3385 TaxID=1121400 RepID=A0A1W2BYF7_9BACT|nr:DUF364 domain-containing protein [Desulfocicer vacuolatum]SMC78007.1 Putative heavy-metal chelation [Desulfocicer vacuolatum DSM 3385]